MLPLGKKLHIQSAVVGVDSSCNKLPFEIDGFSVLELVVADRVAVGGGRSPTNLLPVILFSSMR